MAPKNPTVPSSSEAESEDLSDSQNPDSQNTDSDTDEPQIETTHKPSVEKPDSEPEEGDDVSQDSSDESDTDTEPADFTVKPTVSKPAAIDSPKSKKPSAPKKASETAEAEKKKSTAVRGVWTEESELAVLRAMNEYKSKKGVDPYNDMGLFFEFAKKFVPVEVTKNQLMDRIRRLKKKYEGNAERGEEAVFGKAYETKAFDLSKRIWGGAESGVKSAKRKAKVEDSVEKEGNEGDKKSSKKVKKEKSLESVKEERKEIVVQNGVVVEGSKGEGVGFWDKYPRLKMALEVENGESFFKDGNRALLIDLSKMGDAKAKELEEKWKRYLVKEAELKIIKTELVMEQTKAVLEQLRKN